MPEIGERVIVRRRAGVRDGRPVFTDVLGTLLAAADEVVVVRTATAGEIVVPLAEIAAAKAIPPSRRPLPPRHHDDLDDLALDALVAPGWTGLVTRRLGGWLLRAAGGWTGRANSVLALGDPGTDLDDALSQVRGWYADQGLPPLVHVGLPARADLAAALVERGWHDPHGGLVQTAPIHLVRARTAEDLPPVTFAERPDADWLGLYRYRGGPLPAHAVAVLTAPAAGTAPLFASVALDGRTVAVGRAVAYDGWVGLAAVEVAQAYRRRGLARHLLAGVLAHTAGRHGARDAWLQVAPSNAGAVQLYSRAGFTTHHQYRYYRPAD